MTKAIPGTNKEFKSEIAFDEFDRLIELTDGLTLSQVCAITDLDQFVIQNWVKRGYVARPVKKKYYAKQLARILMINSLKYAMKIETIGELMKLVNGDVEDESDDLCSEEELYNLFASVIYHLEDVSKIDMVINKVLKDHKQSSNKKLVTVLEIMVHCYIAGEHEKLANKNLEILRKENK